MNLTQAGLCEGYGGLSRAVAGVLGAELVWYSEYEPATEKNPNPTQAAARLLAHHHPGLPNHGDLTVADWSAVERPDVLTGGWPCQPFSTAGRQKGAADERAIWPFFARAIRDLRPRIVVLENVPNVIAMGELGRAVGDLAGLGYVGAWRCIPASDVGAPHRRRRVFIVAATNGHGEAEPGRRGGIAPDTSSDRRGEGWTESARLVGGSDAAQRGPLAASDTDSIAVREQPITLAGCGGEAVSGQPGDIDWGAYRPAILRWGGVLGRPAPAPTVLGKRGGRQLSPAFVEFLMGLPEGHVDGVPGLTRNEKLKILGNGVVPQQAAHAIRLALPSVLASASGRAA